MNPATILAIFSLVEELIKIEPSVVAELSAIFSKPNPTPEDWQALRAKVTGEAFESLAPAAAANLAPVADAATPTPEVADAATPTPAPAPVVSLHGQDGLS